MKALHTKYPQGAYALFEQVGNSTGSLTRRHADAIVISLWPSRGLEVYGFEIKVSNNDWRRELKNPKKAEEMQKYCHRWWVVSANAAVPVADIPPNWGLMEYRQGKFFVAKEAPLLEPVVDMGFVAALLRRAHDGMHLLITKARQEGRLLGEQTGPDEHAAKLSRVRADLDKLKRSLDRFEETSGIRIDQWNGERVGKAFYKYLSFRTVEDPAAEYDFVAGWLEQLAKRIKDEAGKCRDEAKILRDAKDEAAE